MTQPYQWDGVVPEWDREKQGNHSGIIRSDMELQEYMENTGAYEEYGPDYVGQKDVLLADTTLNQIHWMEWERGWNDMTRCRAEGWDWQEGTGEPFSPTADMDTETLVRGLAYMSGVVWAEHQWECDEEERKKRSTLSGWLNSEYYRTGLWKIFFPMKLWLSVRKGIVKTTLYGGWVEDEKDGDSYVIWHRPFSRHYLVPVVEGRQLRRIYDDGYYARHQKKVATVVGTVVALAVVSIFFIIR